MRTRNGRSALAVACRVGLGLGTLPIAVACNRLPDIDSNQCGNGVVESKNHEECDTYAPEGEACWPPGTAHECRYQCATSPSGLPPHCPTGYGCGVDGVCRKEMLRASSDSGRVQKDAQAQFTQWGDSLPISARSLELGDFDGDGIKDLLALGHPGLLRQAHPTIVFFDQTSTSRTLFDPRLPISSPVVTTLNAGKDGDDRREQVIFSTYVGIGTLAGTKARSVLPIVYPFQVLPEGMTYRLLRIRGLADDPLGEGILIFLTSLQGNILTPADGPGILGPLPASMSRLAGEPVAADFIVSKQSPCEEAILTFRGDATAYLVDACDENGKWRAEVRTPEELVKPVVHLRDGHTIERQAVAARVNTDPFVDLVLTDELGRPHVAFGLGNGRFAADPDDPATVDMAWPVVMNSETFLGAPLPNGNAQSPLAVGDLNEDTIPDWVLPDGIRLVGSIVPDHASAQIVVTATIANTPFASNWSIARIVDLNGDGHLDVVVGSSEDPDLDWLEGTGRDRLTAFPIRTEGPVSHIAVGDFDGDLIQDVAFVDRMYSADSSAPASERLAIAFGMRDWASQLPTAVRMGTFDHISQLQAGCYEGDDAIDELGVMDQRADGRSSLTIFFGNSVRLPVAPLGLASIGPDRHENDTPLGSGVGRFAGTDEPSVIAVGAKGRLWLLRRSANGDFDIPWGPSRPLPSDIVIQGPNQELSFFVLTGDVDRHRDGDEAFLLAASPQEWTFGLWQIPLSEDGTAWTGQEPVELRGFMTGKLLADSAPVLQDVDNNGWPDLVLIRSTAAAEAEVVVFWNDAGQLALDAPSILALEGRAARGFAVARDRGRQRLVVTTDEATYEVRVDAQRSFTAARIPDVVGGNAVALGDVTGDGLLDLVLAVPEGIRVFAEKTEEP